MLRPQIASKLETDKRLELSGPAGVKLDSSSAGERKLREAEMELLVLGARTHPNAQARKLLVELLHKRLNWNRIIEAADSHRIVPLLFRNLSPYAPDIPPAVLERLKKITLQNNFRNLYLTAELTKLIKVLEKSGIRALPFKGPLLATTVYGDLSLRQFCDLDILIPKRDVQKAKELFIEIGYIPLTEKTQAQDAAYLKSARPYNYKFASANGIVYVELHWQFTSKYNSFIVDYEQLMDRLVRVDFAGEEVRNLKPEDLLLILSQHGSKHFWQHLIWLCDIAELLRRYKEIDWNEVISRADSMGIRRMLFLGLHLSERLFESELPHVVASRIKKDRSVKKLAARIEEQLFSGDSRLIEGFEAHTFSCRMRERVRDRFRYAGYRIVAYLNKAIAPTAKDRDALPSALKFSSLAYVLRPPRLLVENIKKFLLKKK